MYKKSFDEPGQSKAKILASLPKPNRLKLNRIQTVKLFECIVVIAVVWKCNPETRLLDSIKDTVLWYTFNPQIVGSKYSKSANTENDILTMVQALIHYFKILGIRFVFSQILKSIHSDRYRTVEIVLKKTFNLCK